uniref:Uncharacterized protein n=1 Tax=Romanomermis culicivorax TaxID=13658 RepID=A0A915I1J7_ROMCU
MILMHRRLHYVGNETSSDLLQTLFQDYKKVAYFKEEKVSMKRTNRPGISSTNRPPRGRGIRGARPTKSLFSLLGRAFDKNRSVHASENTLHYVIDT